MPWRRKEVAPYVYDEVYVPYDSVQATPYGEKTPRTFEEMDEAFYRATRGREERERRDREAARERDRRPRWTPPDQRR